MIHPPDRVVLEPGPDPADGSGRRTWSLARLTVRDAVAVFRAHTATIVGVAALVLLPFAIADAFGFLDRIADGNHPVGAAANVVFGLFTSGASGLAAVFYAGMLDHVAAAWRKGEGAPTARAVATRLPWRALVAATLIADVLTIGGLRLYVVPGLIVGFGTALTGPLIVSEHLGAFSGLRRSFRLVCRAPLFVLITVSIPGILEGMVPDLARFVFGHSLAVELVSESLAALVLASFVGLLEVMTAHRLLSPEAAQRR